MSTELPLYVTSARSKSGRVWIVRAHYLDRESYRLDPCGHDVVAARSERTGRWQGGVRSLTVTKEALLDPKRWRAWPVAEPTTTESETR